RLERPEGVPATVLDFRYPDPLAMNRFARGDLIAAGKTLDDLAAAMGPIAEPGRQPWRGLGNINLNRFDRASAVPLLSAWVKSLESVQQRNTAMTSLCGWEQLSTIAQISDAIATALAIPDANSDVEEGVLALAAEDFSHRSLAKWVALAEEAQTHDAGIEGIC